MRPWAREDEEGGMGETRRFSPAQAAGLAACFLLGWLGNYGGTPLFFGADLLFGSAAAFVALAGYGVLWGVLVAAAAASQTIGLWGHPYAAAIFTLEIAWVGLLGRARRRPIVLLDALYWLAVGGPLILVCYHLVLQVDLATTAFVFLKQSINGILNALIAAIALDRLRRYWPARGRREPEPATLEGTLFNAMALLVLGPALALTVLAGRHEAAQLERDALREIHLAVENLQADLQVWHRRHLRPVVELAQLAGRRPAPPAGQLQRAVETLKGAFPDFHNMYVANAEGVTIAFYPPMNERGESTIGLNFSDRAYFGELKRTGRPVLSEVFMGRGGVFAPIAALSAPVLERDRFRGFALAAVDLGQVRRMLAPVAERTRWAVTLCDGAGRVIGSSVRGRAPLTPWRGFAGGSLRPLTEEVAIWSPAEPGLIAIDRWRASFYLATRPIAPEIPWTLIIEAPLAPYQARLFQLYTGILGILGAFMLLALPLALIISRRISAPLNQLGAASADLPAKIDGQAEAAWPASGMAEIQSLVANFQAAAGALRTSFGALRTMAAQLEALREVGAELSRELDLARALALVLRHALALVEAPVGTVYLWEAASQRLVPGAWQADDPRVAAVRLALGEGVAGTAAQEGTPRIVNDFQASPYAQAPPLAWMRHTAVLAVPMHSGGRLLGVIAINNGTTGRPFTPADQALLRPFATQAAIAIENARLFTEVQQALAAQRQAHAALAESEARYRALVESSSDWVWEVDAEARYTFASPRVEAILGYPPDEVLGRTPFDLMPEAEAAQAKAFFAEIAAARRPFAALENTRTHREGRPVLLETSGVPVLGPQGDLLGYRGMDRDITRRKAAEESLRASLAEKEVLLQEVHHRVKNNLQIVASLMSLEASRAGLPEVQAVLRDTRARVQAMALLHETLYRSTTLARIDLAAYVPELVRRLQGSVGPPAGRVSVETQVASLGLPLEQAVPCGLIINELVSNALKHAFPGERRGTIRVGIESAAPHEVAVQVADDGVGLPAGFDPERASTLGMRLVTNLAGQLRGRLTAENRPDSGASFRVAFPLAGNEGPGGPA